MVGGATARLNRVTPWLEELLQGGRELFHGRRSYCKVGGGYSMVGGATARLERVAPW